MKIAPFSLIILDGISESYLCGKYGKSTLRKNFKIIIFGAHITASIPGAQSETFLGREGFLKEGLFNKYFIERNTLQGKKYQIFFPRYFK